MARAKKNLGDLIKQESKNLQTSEVTEQRTLEVTNSETSELPKYLTLIRKECRFRDDQIDRLTAIARQLNRRRKGGERITENTLIRIAVDLLLSQEEKLSGVTELELLESVSSEVTE